MIIFDSSEVMTVFIFTFKEAGIALQSVSKLTFVITSVEENAEQAY